MKDSTKKFIKNALIFAGGIVIGAIAGYEIARRKYEVRYEFDDEPEDEEYIEPVREKAGSRKNNVIVIKKDQYKKAVKEFGYAVKDDEIDPSDIEEEIDTEAEESKYEKISNKRVTDSPHIITLEEFSEEMGHYDKSTIYFYEDDDVLADEEEEMIIDPVSILGEDALESFGVGSEDPEVVYVRNDNLQIDYEVIRLSKSYHEVVLGEIGGSD